VLAFLHSVFAALVMLIVSAPFVTVVASMVFGARRTDTS